MTCTVDSVSHTPRDAPLGRLKTVFMPEEAADLMAVN